MSKNHVVIAHYKYLDDIVAAIAAMKARGVKDFRTFSPFPSHELEEAVYADAPRSPVRFFTLIGALTGCLAAVLMTSFMSVDYPLRVSAKPLLSYPAFSVIMFECTVLFGGIVTLLAMFHFSRIPNVAFWADYRPNFSEGTFGLTVRATEGDAKAIQAELEKSGAQRVEVEYVR
ncbi:MAG: DUF3341 domain-containing protein [Deltaproteobacteria bacterium]|nr:DUF3341 domain-containing protein [Deltaproteobacteria bacterium]